MRKAILFIAGLGLVATTGLLVQHAGKAPDQIKPPERSTSRPPVVLPVEPKPTISIKESIKRQDPQDRNPVIAAQERKTFSPPFLQQVPYRDSQIKVDLVGITKEGNPLLSVSYRSRADIAIAHTHKVIKRFGDSPKRYTIQYAPLL